MIKKIAFLIVLASLVLAACSPAAPATEAAGPAKAFGQADCAPNCTPKDLTLCYPQLGAESDWRTANSASFKETSQKLGVKLIF